MFEGKRKKERNGTNSWNVSHTVTSPSKGKCPPGCWSATPSRGWPHYAQLLSLNVLRHQNLCLRRFMHHTSPCTLSSPCKMRWTKTVSVRKVWRDPNLIMLDQISKRTAELTLVSYYILEPSLLTMIETRYLLPRLRYLADIRYFKHKNYFCKKKEDF